MGKVVRQQITEQGIKSQEPRTKTFRDDTSFLLPTSDNRHQLSVIRMGTVARQQTTDNRQLPFLPPTSLPIPQPIQRFPASST